MPDKTPTAAEVRRAIEHLKELLTPKEFAKLTVDQKAFLCQVFRTGVDDIDIWLAHQSLSHPLTAAIKKHRGTFLKRKFYLDGIDLKQQFETRDEAEQFARARGIQII